MNAELDVLRDTVTNLNAKWIIWKQLYMAQPGRDEVNAARIELLNNSAPSFFAIVKSVLIESVVLDICKLLDGAETQVQKELRPNLSLPWLLKQRSEKAHGVDPSQWQGAITSLCAALKPFTVWRNRRIAHADAWTMLGTETLSQVLHKDIDAAIFEVTKAMELLDPETPIREWLHDNLLLNGDGNTLIYLLGCAHKYFRDCDRAGCPALSPDEMVELGGANIAT